MGLFVLLDSLLDSWLDSWLCCAVNPCVKARLGSPLTLPVGNLLGCQLGTCASLGIPERSVGTLVGEIDCLDVGDAVGLDVGGAGTFVGNFVGGLVGLLVGSFVGKGVGNGVGLNVGLEVGVVVGGGVGSCTGLAVGGGVGSGVGF